MTDKKPNAKSKNTKNMHASFIARTKNIDLNQCKISKAEYNQLFYFQKTKKNASKTPDDSSGDEFM